MVTVSGKKLKNSDTLDKMTLSSARKPNLFLKNITLLIFDPTKDGDGAVSKSPTVLSFHVGK